MITPLRHRWAEAVAVAAVAAAFLAGVASSLAPAAPGAAARTGPSGALSVGPGVLDELRRPQRPEDRPRIPVGQRLVPSSFRVIDSGALDDLYVARDVDGHICVVSVTSDDQFAAACGSEPGRLRVPLLLLYTVRVPGEGDPVNLLAGVDPTG